MSKRINFAKFFSTYLRQDIPELHSGDIFLDCPFQDCLKEEHFGANCDTGEWHCLRCDEGGNARTLITKLHQQFLPETTVRQYKYLQDLRKIPYEIFQTAEYAYDADNDRWLVPYFTYDPQLGDFSPFLNNLGIFYPGMVDPKSQFVIRKGPGLPTYLYNPGLHFYPHESKTAIICEGESDTLAYYAAHPDTPHLVLGKPGAGFNKTYLTTLAKCDNIHLLLDNDVSGRKQTAACMRVLSEFAPKKNIFAIDWTLIPSPPKDIRALYMESPKKTPELLGKATVLQPSLSEIRPRKGRPEIPEDEEILTAGYVKDAAQFPPIESYQEYFKKVSTILFLSEETKLAMLGTLAISISMGIPGEPLWSFLVGPGGSGKTTFIESFGGNNQWFDNLSKVTAEAFVSGWRDETGQESSYLVYLLNKCLFVKDFTVTLMSPIEVQRKIFGLLTDIYDGHVKIPFGNNQVKEFHNTYFNMVAGVTDIVNAHSSASIGERFLRMDWLGRKKYDTREVARRALMNYGHSVEHKINMTKYTLGFVRHLREQQPTILIDPNYIDPMLDLAEFVAIVRTKVESDRFEGISYKPRAELPTRLSKQFAKLYTASKLVTNGDNELAFRVVRKLAMDTAYGFSTEILEYILQHPKAARDEIASGIQVHSQKVYNVLRDLCVTGVLDTYQSPSGPRGGNPKKLYVINSKLLPALAPTESEPHAEDRPVRERQGTIDSDNSPRTRKRAVPKRASRVSRTKGTKGSKRASRNS
jgi:hypothetical protein